MKKLQGLSALLISAFVLSSCAAWTQIENRMLVQFETELGGQVADQLVLKGSLASDPNINVPGYLFQGWFTEIDSTDSNDRWDFLRDTVEAPLTLYAQWTAEIFTISFVSVGNLEIDSIDIIFGETLTLPRPIRPGFTFVNWYEDPLFVTVFVAATREAKDYLLYAKWSSFPVLRVRLNQETLVDALSGFSTRFIGNRQWLPQVEACQTRCDNLNVIETTLASQNAPLLFQLPFDGNNTQALLTRFAPYMLDLSTQPWASSTDVGLIHNQKLVGFPLYLKGSGMVYNADIINQYNALLGVTPINPATWFNYQNFTDALVALHSRRAQLGVNSVISFAGNSDLNDIFNAYLSSGKTAKDYSVLYDLELGRYPPFRVEEYANWVKLLVDFSVESTLKTGTTGSQVSAFVNRQAIMMPYNESINAQLKGLFALQSIAMAPLGQLASEGRGIPVHADRSWVFINSQASPEAIELAKAMLVAYTNDLQMRNEIVFTFGHMHAFRNGLLSFTSHRLNQSITTFYADQKTNPYLYDSLIGVSKKQALDVIHRRWFNDEISRTQFVSQLKAWIEAYPT